MNEPAENPTRNVESSKQSVEQRLIEIADRLGFKETAEMIQARKNVAPTDDLEKFREKISFYQITGQQEVDKHADSTLPQAQIGLIIASAGIYHRMGLQNHFLENINDAVTYADNMGFDDLVLELQPFLPQV